MGKGRLEAFSDGVIAIIITIMVLEMAAPHGDIVSGRTLAGSCLSFFSYVLSFMYVGIYWNNHHHMLHGVRDWVEWRDSFVGQSVFVFSGCR